MCKKLTKPREAGGICYVEGYPRLLPVVTKSGSERPNSWGRRLLGLTALLIKDVA